ncbi:MAG: DUF4350 domain-containing protein [Thermoplasmata archaeon]
MKENVKRFVFYISVISVIALIFFLSMFAPMVSTSADFSIYNTGWNGCSSLAVRTYETGNFVPNLELADGDEIEVVQRDLTSYRVEPTNTSIVFIGPDKSFGGDEISYIHSFLMSGGMVLLADDFGTGNTLLQGLNTTSSFRTEPLMDLSFEKSPHFPVIFDIAPHPLTEGVEMLMLNHPTALRLDPNATSVFNSSSASWLKDGPQGRQHILSIENYGEGELILLSDPSLLINSMLDKRDNRQLIVNMIDHLTEERARVIFDESHRSMNILYSMVYNYSPPSETTIFLLMGVGFAASTVAVLYMDWRKLLLFPMRLFRKEERQDVVEKVLKENPDWDERKLRIIYKRFSNESE